MSPISRLQCMCGVRRKDFGEAGMEAVVMMYLLTFEAV